MDNSMKSTVEPSIPVLDFSGGSWSNLIEIAESNRDAYIKQEPFPYVVLDGVFPIELLEAVLKEVESTNFNDKKDFYGSILKRTENDIMNMGPATRRFIGDLNSRNFCTFLEKLTGIESLVPDPYLEGGGLHNTKKGGFLKIHTDFNWNSKLKLNRRINVILYLNKNWETSWGGGLQLWEKDMSRKAVEVEPAFNRMVIFNTSDYSYHGHPDKLACPETNSRKSIAMYYYTNGRPECEIKYGRTTDTNYQKRPGEVFNEGNVLINIKRFLRINLERFFSRK
tara:strand:+ start:13072 stop:13914 length:843 start_codon:yes stop_codon:yes gene_type:complete